MTEWLELSKPWVEMGSTAARPTWQALLMGPGIIMVGLLIGLTILGIVDWLRGKLTGDST